MVECDKFFTCGSKGFLRINGLILELLADLFLSNVRALDLLTRKEEDLNYGIRKNLDLIQIMIDNGEFDPIDNLFCVVDPKEFTDMTSISLLTRSLPFKIRFQFRNKYLLMYQQEVRYAQLQELWLL